MKTRCEYINPLDKKVCGSPVYCSRKRSVKRNGDWVKVPLYLCKDHSYPSRVTQDTSVVAIEKDYSQGEDSPYWDFIGEHSGGEEEAQEPRRANPDALSENDNLWDDNKLTEEAKDTAKELLQVAEKVLTPKQKEVFDLLVFERRNEYGIAARLHISRTTVQAHIKAIQKKLRKYTV